MKPIRTFFTVATLALGTLLAVSAQADFNELLGAREAGAAGDTDRIRVGRALGKFYGLIVETGDPAPVFERIVVHYQEGDPLTVEGQALTRDSHGHASIDFGSTTRRIDRIEIVYGEGPAGAEYRVLGVKTRPHTD